MYILILLLNMINANLLWHDVNEAVINSNLYNDNISSGNDFVLCILFACSLPTRSAMPSAQPPNWPSRQSW